MELISSDTNVWIDFMLISRLELPFRLSYTYIMNWDAINDELLYPSSLRQNLLKAGLQGVELSESEFWLAMEYAAKYPGLSVYDRIALSIAKVRGITLLTGDGHLRKAAVKESVPLLGTIGLLDQLHNDALIDDKEYLYCLETLSGLNGGEIRLPARELEERIQNCRKEMKEMRK